MFEDALVPFTIRTAQMLMAIAEHPQLSNSAHAQNLPPSWRTLYEFTKVEPKTPKKERMRSHKGTAFRMVHLDGDNATDWLARMDKDAKEARDRKIFDLWLACWTQQEIATEVGCSAGEVSAITSETADLPKLTKPDRASAEHAVDFDPPIGAMVVSRWRGKLNERSGQVRADIRKRPNLSGAVRVVGVASPNNREAHGKDHSARVEAEQIRKQAMHGVTDRGERDQAEDIDAVRAQPSGHRSISSSASSRSSTPSGPGV